MNTTKNKTDKPDFPDHPGWEKVKCWCRRGIDPMRSHDGPVECDTCGGSGWYAHHPKSGVYAHYPGGPFC